MIYLDYNATTPTAPQAVEAMLPYLREYHGNPSAAHAMGAKVKAGLVAARAQVAELLAAGEDEIVFTSGGSESNNAVIKGLAQHPQRGGDHVVTSAVEHPAVLNPLAFLERQGFSVTRVPVDGTGMVDPDDIRRAVTPRTMLITIMHANNEVGTIQPIADIARVARETDVPLHTDAAQAVGKIATRVDELGVDFLTVAGHKLYAPPGIGALYIRSGRTLEPLIHGAGHEKGRRAGTEAAPNIVALGAAAVLADDRKEDRLRGLTRIFYDMLREGLGDTVVLNGHPEQRLPNTLNIGFRGHIGVHLLARMTELCASPGAACHYDQHDPSPVLCAMNVPHDVALGAIRFSLGKPTTEANIETAARHVIETVRAAS